MAVSFYLDIISNRYDNLRIFLCNDGVNFARIVENGSTVLEYRTFQRGINKETLSCGTGAVAVAYIARQLNLIPDTPVDLWRHLARWYDRGVRLQVAETTKGWRLNAIPKKIFQGIYQYTSSGSVALDEKKYFSADINDDSHLMAFAVKTRQANWKLIGANR
jgi:diaminopimelate epimerase